MTASAREREVVSAYCARRVDGLIVVPVAGSHRFLKEQQALGVKVVCVDRPADNLEADTVLVDDRRGAFQAVRHLIDQGHRRIGYLGDRDDIWAVRERYRGLRRRLRRRRAGPRRKARPGMGCGAGLMRRARPRT